MTDLAWERIGAEDAPALVWGHGLTGSRAGDDASGFFDLGPAITAVGWQLVRYDARGHGASPAPAEPERYRWPNLAPDLLAVADAAGLDRFVCAGASMGCATTLYAALAAPARMRALVLVVPPTAWETRRDQAGGYETMAAIAESKGLAHLADLAAQQPATTLLGEEAQDRGIANLRAMPAAALPSVFRGAAASDLPDPDRLRSLTMPALILAWAGDPGHPESTATTLAAVLPDARLEVARTPEEVHGWPDRIGRFLRGLI